MEGVKKGLLVSAIEQADVVEINTLWAVLKYKELGIFKKLKSMALILDVNFEEVLKDVPRDEEERVLDKKTRHLIHDVLIEVSQKEI